jgi:hypothetical protein
MKAFFLLLILFFSFNAIAFEKVFYEDDDIKGKLFLWTVENRGNSIRAFVTFDIKQQLTMKKAKFYSQYIEYSCGDNLPILLEDFLTTKSSGKGEKISDTKNLDVLRKSVTKSYIKLYEEICI